MDNDPPDFQSLHRRLDDILIEIRELRRAVDPNPDRWALAWPFDIDLHRYGSADDYVDLTRAEVGLFRCLVMAQV